MSRQVPRVSPSVHSKTPKVREVLRSVREHLAADVAFFHRILIDPITGQLRAGPLHTAGDPEHVLALRRAHQHVAVFPDIEIDEVPPHKNLSAWDVDSIPRAYKLAVLKPAAIVAIAARLVVENDRCVGLLAATSQAPRQDWTAEHARAWRPAEADWLKALTKAYPTPARDDWRPIIATLSADGALTSLGVDGDARRFDRYLSTVLDVVHDLKEHGAEVVTRHCGGAHLRVQRVRGDTRTEYVVQVQPYQPWRMPRVFALTRAQRTICRYLVEGATMAETARALDRSVDTVRSHVRRIYAHLDVGSRAELCTYVMNREPAPWAPNPRAP